MDEQEEKLLRSVALQNAQSVLSARQRAEGSFLKAKEALEEEKRVLELLNKTAAMLVSKLDFESLVQAVTDAATELSGAEFGAFFYTKKDEQGGSFMLYSLSGAPREAFERFGHPRATPLFGPTFRGEGVTRIGNVHADPRYGKMAPHQGMPKGHLPVCSYLAVPVISRSGEVMGGLFFGHSKPDIFTERAEKIVVGVAAQAAIAIDNARLYDEAKRSAEERAQLLSAERAARSEVERVNLIKDEFLATLSHELRTPMNAVLGWAEILLARSKHDTDDHRRGLETIARNARAQARLIEDLLDMNRIVSGKIRLDVQRMDLLPVVEAAVESARPSAEPRGIRIRTVLDPQAGPVSGDPNRIQQVVWNLLTNAVKFSAKGGAIDVFLERVDSHIEITVADKGVGIAREFLPHVFERFRQADATTTRKFGGLGLGLSIVKQLVELHGGSIRAHSPGLDQGATFVVSLPVAVMRDQAGREHPALSKGPGPVVETRLDDVSVLVVDDEADARELLRIVLSDAKATTTVASSAAEALTFLRARRFDVIVSDIGMPEKDGYELIRDVRRMPEAEGGRTPAIAVTAFARSEDRTRAMRAGYQVHIAKPIEPQELIATIGSLLGRLHAQ